MAGVDSATRERRQRIRHLGRLATRLAATWYRDPHDLAVHGPIFEVGNLQAFRAAFVEVSYANPFEIIEREGAVEFNVAGSPLARVTPRGTLELKDDYAAPHSLAPGNVNRLAARAFSYECARISGAYERRTGHCLKLRSDRGGYGHSRPRALAGLAAKAIKDFCAHLEPAALAALRHAGVANLSHARATRHVFGPNGWRWIQAIRAYPGLMNWALGDYVEASGELSMAIEGGRPLVPALAMSMGLTEAQVRRFRGLTPQRLGPCPGPQTVQLIAQLPQHLWPSSRKQWRAASITLGCATFLHDGELPSNQGATLFRGVRGPIDQIDPTDALMTIRDVLNHLRYIPHHGPEMLERVRRMSLSQLVRLTREWHRP